MTGFKNVEQGLKSGSGHARCSAALEARSTATSSAHLGPQRRRATNRRDVETLGC